MACENKTVNKIVEVLNSKSAEDITVLNVEGLTTLTDYFVLATGKNELGKDGIFHINKEGYRTGDWILIGFNDAIVHIFKPDTRDFYNLERVWSDAVEVDISDLVD